jgi:dihydropteroate synthase
MRAAVAAGASIINSVWALRLDDSLSVAAELDVPVCLMHMQGTPATMQQNPAYQDVVAEVKDFLAARIAAAVDAGKDYHRSRIWVRQDNRA